MHKWNKPSDPSVFENIVPCDKTNVTKLFDKKQMTNNIRKALDNRSHFKTINYKIFNLYWFVVSKIPQEIE